MYPSSPSKNLPVGYRNGLSEKLPPALQESIYLPTTRNAPTSHIQYLPALSHPPLRSFKNPSQQYIRTYNSTPDQVTPHMAQFFATPSVQNEKDSKIMNEWRGEWEEDSHCDIDLLLREPTRIYNHAARVETLELEWVGTNDDAPLGAICQARKCKLSKVRGPTSSSVQHKATSQYRPTNYQEPDNYRRQYGADQLGFRSHQGGNQQGSVAFPNPHQQKGSHHFHQQSRARFPNRQRNQAANLATQPHEGFVPRRKGDYLR
ncbi:hypothetical protein K505DRAFT_343798 [Melanomma pulvis-pyrius CBS 109.77]|uniref:Uncharacterized protein n=1 Tax=Melanomma pulvis-pyrius CBS 109.77 TaxID=1314802 RepID=A0A6A6WQT1_9PLEO|nr:hypothetical protein K505DRAFT_343798 [Melanomma pulvis-pyrius CBS 109.77]